MRNFELLAKDDGLVRVLGRRHFLSLAGLASVSALMATKASAAGIGDRRSRLILLGTGGGPVLGGERAMMSSVIVVGGSAYLIDCGYGAAGELARAGVAIADLGSIFITHNHADHMMDYGSILFFEWLQGRSQPVAVYGPSPLPAITKDILDANAVPLAYYAQDMAMGPMPPVTVKEIVGAGAVMQDGNVRVTCTTVHHPPVVPAFAYRFDMSDRSIVFSGDTSPSNNLIALAMGADILVHEATQVRLTLAAMQRSADTPINRAGGSLPRGFNPDRFAQHVLNAHTSAEDAGRIAAAAQVKTLVLSHLSPGSSSIAPDTLWIEAASRHFSGKIIVGHDGLTL